VRPVSSAGFHALLIANRDAAGRDTQLALCGMTGEVKRLFDMTGFNDEFLIFATQADGLASCDRDESEATPCRTHR
jgi:anti-anti-sigma regulatory factor